MLNKMISFSLFCAIFLMVGCAGPPKLSLDKFNIDNPDSPLRITVFQIDRFVGINGAGACTKDGSVWLGHGGTSTHYLAKYSAGTGVKLASVPLKGQGFHFCAVTSNSVWVTGGDVLSGFSLTQIDIATDRIVKVITLEGHAALTTEHDTLWILMVKTGKLYRIIEKETNLVFLSNTRARYQSIAFAAGSIWAFDEHECLVDRIEPNSGKVLAEISATPQVEGSSLFGSAGFNVGSPVYREGSVWLTCSVEKQVNGKILRIDPDRNEVIANIPVGRMPKSIVFAMGAAWVSTFGTIESNGYHVLEKIDVHANEVMDKYRLESPDWIVGREQPWLVSTNDTLWAISDGFARHIKVK